MRLMQLYSNRAVTGPVNNELTVGRDPMCGVALRDGTVSRLHARFCQEGKAWYVEDMGSKNGTRLLRPGRGEQRVMGRVFLCEEDVVFFGESGFWISLKEAG